MHLLSEVVAAALALQLVGGGTLDLAALEARGSSLGAGSREIPAVWPHGGPEPASRATLPPVLLTAASHSGGAPQPQPRSRNDGSAEGVFEIYTRYGMRVAAFPKASPRAGMPAAWVSTHSVLSVEEGGGGRVVVEEHAIFLSPTLLSAALLSLAAVVLSLELVRRIVEGVSDRWEEEEEEEEEETCK